jgi:hypothetical protein
MEIYTAIASWIGWPPLVILLIVIGSFGVYFYQRHIEILKEKVDFQKEKNQLLESELQESRNHTPDILAQKLADRQKLLERELELAAQGKEQDDQKIMEFERDLQKTRDDAEKMFCQLAQAHEILGSMDRPRDGEIIPQLAQDILKTVESQSCIFIPVRVQRELDNQAIEQFTKNSPFKIELIYPGMFKLYLEIFDNKNSSIGFIENPYIGFYEKDYFVTLIEILKDVPNEVSDQKATMESCSSTILLTSEFHALSSINPEIIYLKVLIDKTSLAKMVANPLFSFAVG